MKTKLITLTSLLALPLFASAQNNFSTLQSAIDSIGSIINSAIPVLIAAAVLVFIFGVVKFIVNAGKDDERKKGASIMISGIIGLFVILSVFALVNILQRTFGVDNQNTIQNADIPTIPGVN